MAIKAILNEGCKRYVSNPLQEASVQAERIVIKCGLLEVDLDWQKGGTVKINGERVSCQALTFSFDFGDDKKQWPPRIEMRLIPVTLNAELDSVVAKAN